MMLLFVLLGKKKGLMQYTLSGYLPLVKNEMYDNACVMLLMDT
jgi:hypothetical protein